LALYGTRRCCAEHYVLAAKLLDEFAQVRKIFGSREQDALFGIEVIADLLLEEAGDFSLQRSEVGVAGAESAVDADAKGECMLMLVRERNEGRVAKHDPS
jgi:hypothetical protein